MPLPNFEDEGDLPVGVHQASLAEVLERFGSRSAGRIGLGLTITNDQELEATQERIRRFQAQIAHLRKVEKNPLAYRLSASGFLAEVDRMQLEVRDYFALHPSELAGNK